MTCGACCPRIRSKIAARIFSPAVPLTPVKRPSLESPAIVLIYPARHFSPERRTAAPPLLAKDEPMRIDRLTSKLQLALSDAQSLAVGRDTSAIEPRAPDVSALLEQQGGSIRPLLMQVGFDIAALRQALAKALDDLPKIQNPTGDVNMSQDLARLLNVRPTSWPSSARETSSSPASCSAGGAGREGHPLGKLLRGPGAEQGSTGEQPSTRCAAARRWRTPTPRSSARRWRSTPST